MAGPNREPNTRVYKTRGFPTFQALKTLEKTGLEDTIGDMGTSAIGHVYPCIHVQTCSDMPFEHDMCMFARKTQDVNTKRSIKY